MNRRTFIIFIASSVATYPLNILAERRLIQSSTENLKEPWKTIAAVQEHLFPADEQSPGAADIGALNYLQNMISAPDISKSEREHIHNGAGWLNDLSVKTFKRRFIELNEIDREKILRKIEQSRAGSRWLSLLMDYLIEALLSDPIYGGNKKASGWKWLEHQPGFPTPTAEKKYFKIGHLAKRRTKA